MLKKLAKAKVPKTHAATNPIKFVVEAKNKVIGLVS